MYCLFTANSTHNGHGTSFIVRPNTVSHLLGLGSLEDQPAPSRWLPGTPSARVQSNSNLHQVTDPAYRIDSIKGQGVTAVRPIKQGAIIMVDYPALLISEGFLQGTGLEGKGHLRRRMVKRGMGQLPESTRQQVMGLRRGPGQYEVDAILGVNLKGLGGVGGSTLVLLEDQGTMDDEDGLMGLFPQVASHSRRVRMQELYNTMLHANSEGFYGDAIKILKDWLDFAQEEGLTPLMGEYHGILAELHLLLAEKGSTDGKTVDREAVLREALRNARMAVDAWARLGSVDTGKTEEARVLLEKIFQLKERKRKGS
ncbi:hypothetical protein B0T20DRAFT_353888 [Sordaria brevicollis]|uniref:SET domain-containing protein n=1 Tax=Sordaria brevicollis TaxID=83679 RepID=A0AAE0UCA5_SORBR|nr:hypothetical protein B0T20DRAFT_353888 [Sordaria brevicollis]